MKPVCIFLFALPFESAGLRAKKLGEALAGTTNMEIFECGIKYCKNVTCDIKNLISNNNKNNNVYIISAGLAGGLTPDLGAGDLIFDGDKEFVEELAAGVRAAAEREGIQGRIVTGGIHTSPVIVPTPAGKTALGRSTGKVAVAMEGAIIEGIAKELGCRFLEIRAISDASDRELPVPAEILTLNAARLALWLAAHPGSAFGFVRLVRDCLRARRNLTWACCAVLATIGPNHRR